jgi:hypothetical protein
LSSTKSNKKRAEQDLPESRGLGGLGVRWHKQCIYTQVSVKMIKEERKKQMLKIHRCTKMFLSECASRSW